MIYSIIVGEKMQKHLVRYILSFGAIKLMTTSVL